MEILEFTDEELEVAAILLELRNPVVGFPGPDCGLCLPAWGCKRARRSFENATSSRPGRLTTTSSSSSPSFPPSRVSLSSLAISDAGPTGMIAAKKVVATEEAASPATPLSFGPSDSSDEKPPPKPAKRKASKQKAKEELEAMLDEEKRCNVMLTMKKVLLERVLWQLKADKILLTARGLELSKGNLGLEASNQLDTVRLLPEVDSIGDHLPLKPGVVDHHHQPLTADRRTDIGAGKRRGVPRPCPCPCPLYPISTNGSIQTGTKKQKKMMIGENVGPRVVPDLPLPRPVDSSSSPYLVDPTNHQRFDQDGSLIKARAAQARQIRMQICRGKSSRKNKAS